MNTEISKALSSLHNRGAHFVRCGRRNKSGSWDAKAALPWKKIRPSVDEIREHLAKTERDGFARHVGLVPGSMALVCIDADHGGRAGVETVCKRLAVEPVAVLPSSKPGRFHVYFVAPASMDGRPNWYWDGASGQIIAGTAGYAVLWDAAGLADALDMADMFALPAAPDLTLLPPLTDETGKALSLDSVVEGARNEQGNALAFKAGCVADEKLCELVREKLLDEGYDADHGEGATDQLVKRAYSQGLEKRIPPVTEDDFDPAPEGDAPRSSGPLSHVRFARAWQEAEGRRFLFDGMDLAGARYWRDGEGWISGPEATAAAIRTVQNVMEGLCRGPDAGKWLRRAHIGGALSLAIAADGMIATADRWDRDPELAGLPGGLAVNLRTGKTFTPGREHFISRRLGAAPDASTSAPLFRGLLDTVTGGDKALGRALRAVAGTMLCGRPERALVLIVGRSGTGKTAFAETVLAAIGDYGSAMRGEALSGGRGEHPTIIAALEGMRGVVASELKGGVWRSEFVKRLTGADSLSAHAMRQDERTFQPSHTLLIVANPGDLPGTSVLDDAMRARVRVLPFDNRPGRETPHLAGLIAERELPAVTAWALAGAADILANGFAAVLDACPAIREATEEWRQESDPIAAWIERACIIGPARWEERSALYDSYSREAGDYPASNRAFYAYVGGHFGKPTKRHGRRGFAGLSLGKEFPDD